MLLLLLLLLLLLWLRQSPLLPRSLPLLKPMSSLLLLQLLRLLQVLPVAGVVTSPDTST
jgi:hypothetical protein